MSARIMLATLHEFSIKLLLLVVFEELYGEKSNLGIKLILVPSLEES